MEQLSIGQNLQGGIKSRTRMVTAHDHSYCIKSSFKVKRQVDDLIDKMENFRD
jgi:hypothetical protein